MSILDWLDWSLIWTVVVALFWLTVAGSIVQWLVLIFEQLKEINQHLRSLQQ